MFAVGVGVGFKLIKWTPPFPPRGRSAQEKNRLILKPLPLANPKGHVASAFRKKGDYSQYTVIKCYSLLTLRMPTPSCANA